MKVAKKTKINVAIPTASMPDIIFMLLIFFMVATVIRTHSGLKVSLPDAEKIQKIPGSKRHVSTIWLDRNNTVVCDDYQVKEISELRNVVYNKLIEDRQLKIALKIEKTSEMEVVNKVQQELRKANALAVYYFAVPGGID